VSEALNSVGEYTKIIEVNDNNDIDREVTAFYEYQNGLRLPMKVVIEALWVVPQKFDVLKKLHPKIEWCIHLHSNIPFLAQEGNAMEWLIEYGKRGLTIIANSEESFEALKTIVPTDQLIFLPNVYLRTQMTVKKFDSSKENLHIGCFGAIRSLKNNLFQAMAALRYAKENNLFLHFHINYTRLESGGEPVLKNLIKLFDEVEGAILHQHTWFEPEDFVKFLNKEIDLGMQISLSETFNVVTADYLTAGVPIVVSQEIKWASGLSKSGTNDIKEAITIIGRSLKFSTLTLYNQSLLNSYSKNSRTLWIDWINS
jgi:hypothetical protein